MVSYAPYIFLAISSPKGEIYHFSPNINCPFELRLETKPELFSVFRKKKQNSDGDSRTVTGMFMAYNIQKGNTDSIQHTFSLPSYSSFCRPRSIGGTRRRRKRKMICFLSLVLFPPPTSYQQQVCGRPRFVHRPCQERDREGPKDGGGGGKHTSTTCMEKGEGDK